MGREGSEAKREDLYKMHTYRDALDVRAAVAIYPGERAVFYGARACEEQGTVLVPSRDAGRDGTVPNGMTLGRLLMGDAEGVGALPMRPKAEGSR